MELHALHAREATEEIRFDEVYQETAPVVVRTLRRLVPTHLVEDAFQDVFLTVARRLEDFESRSTLKTWVIGIAVRVASDHRRTARRAERRLSALGREVAPRTVTPEQQAVRADQVRLLHRVLEEMRDEHREVLVLVELEQMAASEVAKLLVLNPNTLYSRLRAARAEFNGIVVRFRQGEAEP
ncbi:MAG: sigma-70 family RNA polymerase sigma factor [Polyangiaceae bacterium]